MILISACLAGKNCKYNGGNNARKEILEFMEKEECILVCPEQLGGLPTPRPCSEIQGGQVMNTEGIDVTKEYVLGAKKALEIAKEHHCTTAILKAKSPSCGCGHIYDGTFSHTVIDGDGIFVRLAKENGITCINDEDCIKNLTKRNREK